ncbi:MAG: 30S ribosomal protein S13 [Candidatus Aenigmatarchaeota archaeon]|nr:MAG: 30S ribosomal protein S13 [Candidatus Aenigmarchaeota archaeon]
MEKKKHTRAEKKEIPKGKKPGEAVKKEKRVQDIIRLVETNLDGGKPVNVAIRSIRGVSFMFSNAVSQMSGFGHKKLGELSEQEVQRLEDIILNPDKFGIPSWLYNRKRDPATGRDTHLSVSKLELTQKMDINEMKKLKSYRGVRHILGLPVRGQRTGSGSGGKTVGVSKKKQRPAKSKRK